MKPSLLPVPPCMIVVPPPRARTAPLASASDCARPRHAPIAATAIASIQMADRLNRFEETSIDMFYSSDDENFLLFGVAISLLHTDVEESTIAVHTRNG